MARGSTTGLERFEGRSSLKTWLFRILTNKAKTRGVREARTLPFSSFVGRRRRGGDGGRRRPIQSRRRQWSAPPRGVPEERLLAGEARRTVEEAIAALPENQRAVITLRDVEGLSPRRPATFSGFPRRINECCSTGPAQRCGPRSSSTWRMHERNDQRPSVPGDRRAGHRLSRGRDGRRPCGRRSTRISPAAGTARTIWSRCARRSESRGRSRRTICRRAPRRAARRVPQLPASPRRRRSAFGRYQFRSPSSVIDAGRRTRADDGRVDQDRDARPTPACLTSSDDSVPKIAKTPNMTSAALVTTAAVAVIPCRTASSVGRPASTPRERG